MDASDRVRAGLNEALRGTGRGAGAADRLCGACVDLLEIDGAALSIISEGAISRSFGASSELSRELDELQFTFGEGPCLDAVRGGAPVMVSDLAQSRSEPWPAFSTAALDRGVRAVFALPVSVASMRVGALDLYRSTPGVMDASQVAGGLVAAELAALPLLDIIGSDLHAAVNDETSSAWNELTTLTRVEVYQAAGILIAQLGVGPTEAMVRLRAYAFAHDMTASAVAFDIIEHRLRLDNDRPDSDPAVDESA
jgi:hypothetical protein